MSLEQLISENTEAIRAITRALETFMASNGQATPETPKAPKAAKLNKNMAEIAATEPVGYNDLADAFRKAMQEKGRPWAVQLLSSFNLKDLKSAAPEQYEAIMTSIVGVSK